jgi:hypothetical protein
MKMIKFICLSLALTAVFSAQATTHEEAFVKEFIVDHLKPGDGVNFPKGGQSVTVHYIGTFPKT